MRTAPLLPYTAAVKNEMRLRHQVQTIQLSSS